jgi:UDP-N-acetylmuramoyl-tripeptide--D-alanyl-D-alanine ligase
MLRDLPLALIAGITGGVLTGNDDEVICHSVSTDTRTLEAGSLYVPLTGERFNGHQFAGVAEENGAVAMLASEETDTSLPVIRVNDTLKALGQLSAWHRNQFEGPVVAVTGSAGKTSVKQLTADVLAQRFCTLMTQGNLNNHIGAPLTLLSLEPQHEAAMIELGASAGGEIAYTAAFVRPHVGIITNVGTAHLEGFGSVPGIAEAKGELIDFIQPGGTAVLNADDVFIDAWRARASHLNIVTFGVNSDADVRAENIRSTLEGSEFDLIAEGGTRKISLHLMGEHNVRNALAVIAATRAVGLSWDEIIAGLSSAQAVGGRMQSCQGTGGQKIINDAYNANPSSFFAAVDVLSMASESWLVMGDMAELGQDAEAMHASVGEYARRQGIKHFVACGPLSKAAATAFGDEAHWFSDRDQLQTFLNNNTRSGDTLLIKGSRSAGMDKVVTALCADKEEN